MNSSERLLRVLVAVWLAWRAIRAIQRWRHQRRWRRHGETQLDILAGKNDE